MHDWIRCLLRESAHMILAGHQLSDTAAWKKVFTEFWSSYRLVNEKHVVFRDRLPLECTIPFFFHGDEGRGYCRRPFMVEAFQPVISHKGLCYTNESGQHI